MASTDANRKPRKVDQAYEHLRLMIVTLELEPGSPVDERSLMDRLQIGRTPIREAIQRLIHEGMITHTPRRGSWVSPLSFIDLQQMIDARRMLEVECARLAAINIQPDTIEELRRQVLDSAPAIRAGDGAQSVFIDQAFHRQIAIASRNRYLVRMTDQIQHELIRYWFVSAMRAGELDTIVTHHLQILDTLERRNPDEAAREMGEHITLFQARLRNLIGGVAPRPEMAAAHMSGDHEC